MSLNNVVSAERPHIAFFGVRNAGKSSLINAVTSQNLSIVSDIKGTTTDPVSKAMEILPLGPVVIIDTPGIDDEGELGMLRIEKTNLVLRKTDIAIIVKECGKEITDDEKALIDTIRNRNIPYLIVNNKCDLLDTLPQDTENEIYVSAATQYGIHTLKERIGHILTETKNDKHIVSDLLSDGDTVLLVIPIDESAPKGRLILPQQQTLREILDCHCTAISVQPEEITSTLSNLRKPPALVITDSQAFEKVNKLVPAEIKLTSFSILFARYKGSLNSLMKGAAALSALKDGDKVLISEGCTHHRQCNDIGTVKMPGWIKQYSGAEPEFSFTSGGEFPEDLSAYKLVVHCGGCMLNEKEMSRRIEAAKRCGVPIVNYGIAISAMHNILGRATEVFRLNNYKSED